MFGARRFAAYSWRVGVPLDAEAGPGRVAHRRWPVAGNDIVCLPRKGPGLGNGAQDGPGAQFAAGDMDGGPGVRGAVEGGVERLVDGVMGGDDAHLAACWRWTSQVCFQSAVDGAGATLGRMNGSSFVRMWMTIGVAGRQSRP